MKKYWWRGVHMVLVSGVLFGWVSSAQALGISPGTIELEGVLPGMTVEQTITVTRANPAFDDSVVLEKKGALAEWVDVDTETFILPKAEEQVRIPVRISVPAEAEPGIYEGSVRIRPEVDSASTAPVDIQAAAETRLRSIVTQEVRASAELQDVQVRQSSGELTVLSSTIRNTGNQPLALRGAELRTLEGMVIRSSAEEHLVEPFSEATIVVTATGEELLEPLEAEFVLLPENDDWSESMLSKTVRLTPSPKPSIRKDVLAGLLVGGVALISLGVIHSIRKKQQ